MSGFKNGRSKEDCESRSPNSNKIPITSRIIAFLRPEVFSSGRIGLTVDTMIMLPSPLNHLQDKGGTAFIISGTRIIPRQDAATVEIDCPESMLAPGMIARGNPRSAVLTSYNNSCPHPQSAHASHCRSGPVQSVWRCSLLKAGEQLRQLRFQASLFLF